MIARILSSISRVSETEPFGRPPLLRGPVDDRFPVILFGTPIALLVAGPNVWIALTKQLRWPPRRRTSPAPGSPSRVPAGTYVVTLDFAEVGGRLECVRFEIGADVDEPNGPDPAPLTASVLRGVPLRELIDQ